MKKILLITVLAALCATMLSQPSGLDRLYYTYKGEKGVVSLRIPGFLLRIAGAIADLDPEERELVRSLRSVTVLTIEDNTRYRDVNFAREVNVDRMTNGYHLLMEVHDGQEDVVIAAREKKGRIRDLIVLVGGDENVLVHVRGRMNSDLLESLAGVTGIEELQLTDWI
ncbi:MAG TPA: DUF4252 domain-containing protein [Bacteroides sp.]|mgnify:CR=1 FL=1|nr:DUF4252 domain-containing protein [Bacteroides sp.]